MRTFGPSALAVLALFLSACSSGSGSGGSSSATGSAMYILTCSLGCPSGQGGVEIHCTPISIAPNQEFVVTFSQPIDPSSVTSETFSIVDSSSGSTPIGTRLVDPVDPRKLIFRPSITFDSGGTPSFGFTDNTSYAIIIKGTQQDANGPFIRSTSGKNNSGRMSCQMQTTSTPVDYVPGAPTVSIFVDLVDGDITAPDYDPEFGWPAEDAVDVARTPATYPGTSNPGNIRFVFNDIMNPVTLANQLTFQSAFATVQVFDTDPNSTTPLTVLSGTYKFDIDIPKLRTVMRFATPNGLPSSGAISAFPRKVLVTFPGQIADLTGHGLANAGALTFTTEPITLAPVDLPQKLDGNYNDEYFEDVSNQQTSQSSGTWGVGRLNRGFGGGSGRLGDLLVKNGPAVVLNTDSQVFPLEVAVPAQPSAVNIVGDILDNSIQGNIYGGVLFDPSVRSSWPKITVTDGYFEFTALKIEPGAKLTFSGIQPAHLLVRGPVEIQGNGILDITGRNGAGQLSNAPIGGAGALGGPNGGAGGKGGDRFDNTANPTLIPCGAIANVGAVTTGATGSGIAQTSGLGGAPGGSVWPIANYPIGLVTPVPAPLSSTTFGGLAWTFDDVFFSQTYTGCQCLQPGKPGGGATYSVAGKVGIAATPILQNETVISGQTNANNTPPNTLAGAATDLESPYATSPPFHRRLDGTDLRGGSGGGGGGTSLFGTKTSVQLSGFTCGGSGNSIPVNTAAVPGYQDNSGAPGGGGGGAIQLVSGSSITVDGVIDARGGTGGGADPAATTDRQRQAAPGGGGSGGAVRIQAPVINLAPVAGRINVLGGAGGVTDMNHLPGATNIVNSIGGEGAAGLIRMENQPSIGGVLNRATIAPFILPFDPLALHPTSGLAEQEFQLSVGSWLLPRKRPESFTASTSCWMQPTGTFFLLRFEEDDLPNPDPALQYGWNMDIVYSTANPYVIGQDETLIKYRGPDPNLPFPSGDFQSNLTNTLGHDLATPGGYLVVRFQGAKSTSSVTGHPCTVQLTGPSANIVPNSLTPWVQHPSMLNAYSPRPDMVRFCVVYDTALVTANSVPFFIKGVTNMRVRVQPD